VRIANVIKEMKVVAPKPHLGGLTLLSARCEHLWIKSNGSKLMMDCIFDKRIKPKPSFVLNPKRR
jgi:hypothetical protein